MEDKTIVKSQSRYRTKKKVKTKDKMYLIIMLILFVLQMYTLIKFRINLLVSGYSFILLVASVMTRRPKNKRLSNMICIIASVFTCLTLVMSAITSK